MHRTLIWRIIRTFARLTLKKLNKLRLPAKYNFVIISNNCWGAEIYKHLNKPYNTPFVGLYLYPECYIKLLEQWDDIISLPLKFRPDNISKYSHQPFDFPIGVLGEDVEIHFMHYKSEEEAINKWNRRVSRMLLIKDKDLYYLKNCDKLDCNSILMDRFHALPYKNKITFTGYQYENPNNIQINAKYLENGEVPSGIALYNLSHCYFDLVYWLKNKHIKSTFIHKIYKYFII